MGPDYADVTEGNPWPIGYVWERLRYDWSHPQAPRGRVIDSNLFKPGSTWELWATPDDGGSHVEIRAVCPLLRPRFVARPAAIIGLESSDQGVGRATEGLFGSVRRDSGGFIHRRGKPPAIDPE